MKKKINWRKIYAIKKQNEQRILKVNAKIPTTSGIYIFTRVDELGFQYAYVGQAKNLLERTASHLNGYQHIDLSLKKHGFYSNDNFFGWDLNFINCDEKELDNLEDKYILKYAKLGYQMRNKTSGRQGTGKRKIAEYKERKGYQQGLKNGYENARKDLQHWFKYLKVEKIKDGKLNERMIERFEDFLKGGNK